MRTQYYGLDLGNSNTVVSIYDVETRESSPLTLPGLSYGDMPNPFGYPGYLIPTAVAMDGNLGIFYGAAALAQENLKPYRDLKKNILDKKYNQTDPFAQIDGSPNQLKLFLHKLIVELVQLAQQPLVLKVSYPINSSHVDGTAYKELLQTMLDGLPKADIESISLCDEPYAAAVGYKVFREDSNQLVFGFDFGSSTVNTVILVSGRSDEEDRIIASCTEKFGGRRIDRHLADYVNAMQFRDEIHPDSQDFQALLNVCELGKVALSRQEDMCMAFRGQTLTLSKTTFDFQILKENGVDRELQTLLEVTLDKAISKGRQKQEIQQVIVTGGGSLLPSVQEQIQAFFDAEGHKILHHEPFAAVAHGLAMVAAGRQAVKELRFDFWVGSYNPDTKSSRSLYKLCSAGEVFPSSQARAFHIEPANWKEWQKPQEEMELQLYYSPAEDSQACSNPDSQSATYGHLVERRTQHQYLGEPMRLYAPQSYKLIAEYWVDHNGVLRLSVMDANTGAYTQVRKGPGQEGDAKELHFSQLD